MLTAVILLALLYEVISRLLFLIDSLICKFIDVLYQSFEVFASIKTITYDGKPDYLLDVFFTNDIISTIYWGMAVIGFAMMFGFAIVAIVRKIFDSTGEKVKATYGHILTNCFKSFLLILLMTAIVSATITSTGVLMRAISDLFDQAEVIAHPPKIVFDDEDFATMYRIFDRIGNYGLNPSYDSRYNLNACFNDIRNDLQDLEKKGVFKFSYIKVQKNGAATNQIVSGYDNNTWQYALLQIYKASDIYKDVDIDSVDETLQQTLLYCMNQIKTNADFKPLKEYTDLTSEYDSIGSTIGKVIMLTASFGNADNSYYDRDPGVMDSLRLPYYAGHKNIYDYDEVDEDFNPDMFHWNSLMVICVGLFVTKEMLIILINAVARIFNIILLYLTAPAFLAVMPLDDGGKFKQWTTAFVIQSLSLFGSLFAVRLLVIFVPIIFSSNLKIFSGAFTNYVAKLAFLIGICVTSEKASGMISGILADNAGYQSIMAGDVGGGVANSVKQLAGKALSAVAGAGLALGKMGLGAAADATGLTTKVDSVKKKVKDSFQSMRDHGGFSGAKENGFKTKEDMDKDDKAAKEEAQDKDTKDFRKGVFGLLQQMAGGGQNPKSETDKKEDEKQEPNPDEQKQVPPPEQE